MNKYLIAGSILLTTLGDVQAQGAHPPEGKPRLLDRFNIVVMAGSYHIGERDYQDKAPEYGYTRDYLTVGSGTTTYSVPYLKQHVLDDGRRPYNEFNPGIGVNYEINKWLHAGAGVYKNSVYSTSVYALMGAETNRGKFVGAGIEIGGVTGYSMDVAPSALGYLRLGKDTQPLNLKIAAIPPVKDLTPAVVTAQLRVNLGAFKPK